MHRGRIDETSALSNSCVGCHSCPFDPSSDAGKATADLHLQADFYLAGDSCRVVIAPENYSDPHVHGWRDNRVASIVGWRHCADVSEPQGLHNWLRAVLAGSHYLYGRFHAAGSIFGLGSSFGRNAFGSWSKFLPSDSAQLGDNARAGYCIYRGNFGDGQPGCVNFGEPSVWSKPGFDDFDWSNTVLHLGYDSGGEPLLEIVEIQSHQSGVLLWWSTPYCVGCQLFRVRADSKERGLTPAGADSAFGARCIVASCICSE